MRRVTVALAVAGLLVAGVISAPLAQAAPPGPAAVPDYQPPPVTWGPCDNPTLVSFGSECGFVTVPLDYAKPRGTKIQLAVSRLKHAPDVEYQGVMLVNPGGPGGSGLIYSVLGAASTDTLQGADRAYDWIGFDPRGVGSSKPALSCDPNIAGYNRPYYIPETPQLEAAWLKKDALYTAKCAVKGGELLKHLTTVDSVKDMDSIRKALGEKQINFYGFSYGTYLGSVYSTLYPKQVRRMVLDGDVDPTRVWEAANYDQDFAFEKSIKVFFAWVAKYDNVYHLGKTEAVVEKQYYDQYQKLRKNPAADGRIGSSEWNDIFVQAGYYVFGWEDIATAFSKWVNNGDATDLFNLYPPPGDDNGYAIYLGVQCSDAKWSSYPQFRKDNAAVYKQAQFLTWGNAWFNAPCTFWPVKGGTPVKVDGSQAPPLLLISETLDAATPYSGALQLRKLFPKSSLVEGVGGTTHAGSLSGVTCTDSTIAAYLKTGATPARVAGNTSDKQCAPVPQPVPTGLAGAAAMAAAGGAAERAAAPGAPGRYGLAE